MATVSEQTMVVGEETTDVIEATMALFEESSTVAEETMDVSGGIMDVDEETMTVNEETKVVTEEIMAAIDKTMADAEVTTNVAEETIDFSEQTTDIAEEAPKISEHSMVVAEQTLAVSEETLVVPQQTTAVLEETTTAPRKTTAFPMETMTFPQQTTAFPEETTAVTQQTTAVPQATKDLAKQTEVGTEKPSVKEESFVILDPGAHDVLLGRGGGTNRHIGNMRFRKLINKFRPRYFSASMKDKPKIAVEVVQMWKNQVPKGRFLMPETIEEKGVDREKVVVWFEVEDHRAQLKTSQCLREKTSQLVWEPGPHDVLLGRGNGTNRHIGNVNFRKLINKYKPHYAAALMKDKPKVAVEVVRIWKNQEPKGRFLMPETIKERGKKDRKKEYLWFEVEDHRAQLKASQCLREKRERETKIVKKKPESSEASQGQQEKEKDATAGEKEAECNEESRGI